MTIYFMGGEMPSFIPSDSSATEVTTVGTFDAAFGRCGLRPGGTGTFYVETPQLTLPDTLYTHIYFRRDQATSLTKNLISYYAGATEVFRVEISDTTLQMKALISAVMTNVGSTVGIAVDTPESIDIYFQGNDATGDVKLFMAGTERASATVDLTSVTGITHARCYHGAFVSQVIIADEPTIGWRLLTRYPNGAGTSSAWTGTYTDVDEIVYDDADFCNSSTNGQVEQFTQTGPAITGYTVRAVGVYARAKRGASGPTNLQIGLRSSGTDYFSASKALSVGYSAYGEIWETNPATSAAWLNTAIDALQPSIKAVT